LRANGLLTQGLRKMQGGAIMDGRGKCRMRRAGSPLPP